jgi:aspartate/methionine/tyrosine aminotransferase
VSAAVFSRRLPDSLEPTAWGKARAEAGPLPFDLTVSNPTACGVPYPPDLLRALASAEGLVHRPDPRGALSARAAVASEYTRLGAVVDPDRVVLTASTSEAYALVLKLLCDPGGAVLVPTPSYPLFDHLLRLEGLQGIPYTLDPHAGWQPRPPALPDADAARAVIVVHPNNPTGSFVEGPAAERLAAARGRSLPPLPLVVDEVFLDYPLDPAARPATYARRAKSLSFTLGGLSKSRGLPQLKLAWIVVSGPDAEVGATLSRLEFIADTYLSVATPVQLALPEILERGLPVRDALRSRCRENLAAAQGIAAGYPAVEVLPPAAGWSVVVHFPRVVSEEALVLRLLTEGVGVFPGYFFDFPQEGYLVASLLPPIEVFAGGFRRMLDGIAAHL